MATIASDLTEVSIANGEVVDIAQANGSTSISIWCKWGGLIITNDGSTPTADRGIAANSNEAGEGKNIPMDSSGIKVLGSMKSKFMYQLYA